MKRTYQLMPVLGWLRLLMNHIPDKYEHLVRYYGYYSNRARGVRRLAEQADDTTSPAINDTPVDSRRIANWAQSIQNLYEVEPLEWRHCGAALRIVALIDDYSVDAPA